MKHKRIVFSLVALLVSLSVWIGLDYHAAINTPAVGNKPVLIEIEKGDSLQRVTEKLLAQNINLKPFWLKVIAIQNNAFKKLKTGEYELTPELTMPEILALFLSGKTKQYSVTFPEGWNFKQILEEIANNPNIGHTLQNLGNDAVSIELGIRDMHPEGELFPDTYFFEKHTSDVSLLKRAHQKMLAVLQQEWANKADNLPLKTPYEALILASIIEKETGLGSERPMIAGVFVRRLLQGMRLQTDPTVIYGLGESYQGDITYQDLAMATPYNTYIINGLPPTPIAMPGRDAINAALHPDHSDNLYFVARGDGSHVFSSSLKTHNLAVQQFQRKK